MTPLPLDIRRPPRHTPRLGKKWTEIAAYRKGDGDRLVPRRLGLHVVTATRYGDGPIEGAVGRRSRRRMMPPMRTWRALAAVMLLMPLAALAFDLALWLLRMGL